MSPLLLDTNALIWLHQDDRRVASIAAGRARLYASPASLLEVEMLTRLLR